MQRLKFIIFFYYCWITTLQFNKYFHKKKLFLFMPAIVCPKTSLELRVESTATNENRLKRQIVCNHPIN